MKNCEDEELEEEQTLQMFEQFKEQKQKEIEEKEKKLQEERSKMKVLSSEELKKLPVKERMAYKQKMKGFQDYKPQQKVVSEEDYMIQYIVTNYNVSEDQAQILLAQQREMEEQQQKQEKKGMGGIQLGKRQNKKKNDDQKKKKPVLFQRLLKQLDGQKKQTEKKKKDIVKVEELVIDESKFTQVDESREPVNIVFIGHVDAGKSTICGSILYYTGMVDQQEIRKFKQDAKDKNRESWFLAYIMDISENERNKGITVEVGKAFFQTENKRFTILDAPGHKNYVPDMIQGAAQADVAALVISSKVGEFEAGFDRGGQTKEHSMLARCLGVKNLIVIINKMDDDNWSEERYKYIQAQLNPFLQDNCGYDVENNVTYVPISGLTGDNINKQVDSSLCKWYNGPTLLQSLDKVKTPKRDSKVALRMPILDKYKDQGLFINGKIESGTVQTGQEVMIMPYRKTLQITHIYNGEDNRVMYAKSGENIKLKVRGIEESDIMRGMVLVDPNSQCYVCNDFEIKLKILELPEHKKLFSTGYTCVMHLHTALEEIEITHVNTIYDEVKKQFIPAHFLKSGSTGVVRARCENYICVDKYDANEHMGAFTLRDEGMTVALGQIVRLKPIKEENIEELSEEMKQLLEAKKKELYGNKGTELQQNKQNEKVSTKKIEKLDAIEEDEQQF